MGCTAQLNRIKKNKTKKTTQLNTWNTERQNRDWKLTKGSKWKQTPQNDLKLKLTTKDVQRNTIEMSLKQQKRTYKEPKHKSYSNQNNYQSTKNSKLWVQDPRAMTETGCELREKELSWINSIHMKSKIIIIMVM